MKKIVICIILSCLAAICASSQNIVVPNGYQLKDSVVFRPESRVDSALVGKSIFSMVQVHQSQEMQGAFRRHLERNPQREMNGYRVRIFFDNKQNSRAASEAAMNRFKSLHPGIPAYRSYESPYFKVTVGDYRTKSEAMALLQRVKDAFPGAFVVKGNIRYPVFSGKETYVVDTIYVLKQEKK